MKTLPTIEAINLDIQELEARRDYNDDLTEKEVQYLKVLNFCYDLLSRTELAQELIIPTPEELKDGLGDDAEFTNIYGITSDKVVNEIFKIITHQPPISIREMLDGLILSSRTKVCVNSGVYKSNLSNYLAGKSEIQTDTFERLLNAAIDK